MKKINVAIDGPAGAGKSTVAKKVADRFSYIYIDTGAMYRSLTLEALKRNVDVHQEADLVTLLDKTNLELTAGQDGQKVYVNGTDVTQDIRDREVTNQVSYVAQHGKVRQAMLDLQRDMAENKGVVMDGRDIGTHVLPHAEVKVYLSASIEERAKRRYIENQQNGEHLDLEKLKEEIRVRDEKDSNREVAPLTKADDATEIDTTGLSIDEVAQRISELITQYQKV
ncbi:(d)CMP kinase [Caldalkalibacillus salinus]|uniref:(d)CMP kinase n=1 Tax=Caldalkalibacillus salinus TaxID=2803787 RepID=UPI001924561A|nr:(d)CMP kinase [Caldalkalibacillus salinus]